MRHIQKISAGRPSTADQFQDVVCALAGILAAVIQAFGGASPIAEYVDSKCAFETPTN